MAAAAYSQDLLDRAAEYAARPADQRRYEQGLGEISALFSEITGEPVGTCRQCQYLDYLAVVTNYIRSATRFLHPETMKPSTYTLAPGFENETFVHEDYNEAITAETLTDEAAEFFIEKGYGHAIVKKGGAKTEKMAPAEKPLTEKQQLQADFEKVFGQKPDDKLTIAYLSEHLSARTADAAYELPTA